MKRLLLGMILFTSFLPGAAWADDDEGGGEDNRCKDGRCCVGIVAFCDNEFPVPLPGNEGGDRE